MTTLDFDNFIDAGFHAWSAGALAADRYKDDNGTCNFDSVDLYIDSNMSKCAEVLKRLDFLILGKKRNFLRIGSPFGGQAMKNTAACEAIAKAFNDFKIPGVTAYVNYRMD